MLKQNLLSVTIIVFFVVVLLLSTTLFFISLAKKSKIESEIASKCEVISEFVKKSKVPMTEESINLLTEERDRLNNIYSRFKLALASSLNEEVSEEELEPLQFKERLIQTQKRLRKDAGSYNLSLPESLGFTKYEAELSEPLEIPDLIKRLRVLEELIHTMMLSRIDALSEINFANRYDALPLLDVTAKERADIYSAIPVSSKISCTISKLIDFLYKLRASSFIFIIDDLDIKSVQEGKLEAGLSIRAIALN